MTLRAQVLLIVALSVVLLVGAAVGFLLVYEEVGEFLKEDGCLDRGGRWHADQGVCEYSYRGDLVSVSLRG